MSTVLTVLNFFRNYEDYKGISKLESCNAVPWPTKLI